ncbi:hypothetical protein GJ744_003567 [Endocarpon pusillum]|uniref:Uncharacterized protein n=1 Tax=Endocarpon pusillum TaxID=364733 RepID=A0A8H7ARR6_9EURO|nr:hypothetical protein GJ744_003567 [Endocarpon pusillum]
MHVRFWKGKYVTERLSHIAVTRETKGNAGQRPGFTFMPNPTVDNEDTRCL